MITNLGSTFPQTGEMPSPTEQKKDNRSQCHSEFWDVSQQWAYTQVSKFIRFKINSTMSKVKLWTGRTYDMKIINHIYNQEDWTFNNLHAWLGKRIRL